MNLANLAGRLGFFSLTTASVGTEGAGMESDTGAVAGAGTESGAGRVAVVVLGLRMALILGWTVTLAEDMIKYRRLVWVI